MNLSLQDIRMRYGGSVALDRVSVTFDGAGVYGIVGPNGSGKSTLLKLIATLLKPTGGTMTLDGTDIVRRPEVMRCVLGYLPQTVAVYPELTAREFLTYVAALKGVRPDEARRQVDGLLVTLNLLLVLAVGALGMTLMSYPLAAFSLPDFLLCFLIPVPGLLFAAALGVLMEALLPRHRSWANGMGLIILLTLWIVSLLPLALDRQGVPAPYCFLDIGGTAALCDQVYSSVRAVLGHDPTSVMILAGMEDVSRNAGLPVATLGLSAPDGLFWVSRVVVV